MATEPIVSSSNSERLDARSEYPAFLFRGGVLGLILVQGVQQTLQLYSIPDQAYLLAAGAYASLQAIGWGLVAFGYRARYTRLWITGGHALGLLTDLGVILYFSTRGPDPYGLWAVMLLPWAMVLAQNSHIVDSVVLFDSLVGLAGVVLLFAGPLIGRPYVFPHTPTNLLLLWGVFLLTWCLLRLRLQAELAGELGKRRSRGERRALHAVLDRVPLGCLVISAKGEVRMANAEARRLLEEDGFTDQGSAPVWILESLADGGWHARRQDPHAPVRRLLYRRLPVVWEGDEAAYLVLLEDGDERSSRGAHEARQERLAAVGQLAAGLAHELGNPIAIIQSCAGYLHDDHREGALGEDLEVIQREAGRCREMIDRMMALASARQSKPQEGDLRESVHRAVGLVRYKAEGAALDISLPSSPVNYVYDDNQMVAILVNLLLNAIASTKDMEIKEVRLDLRAEAGGVTLAVSDTGCGIPQNQLDRVFDPFFTRRDGGTGLGLAMVHQVVTALGGRIDVTSTVGEGTRFTLSLPERPTESSAGSAVPPQ